MGLSDSDGNVRLRSSSTIKSFHSEGSTRAGSGLQRFMLDPNSWQHITYDMLSLLVLCFDLTVIPYVLAWEFSFEGFLHISAWFTCSFWTFDIFLSFLTGYTVKGNTVMNPQKVARNYWRTWFLPDLCVAACDWTSMILVSVVQENGSGSGSLKILRFAKVGRLLRIVALLRMMKVSQIVEEYIELQLSESYKVALKICMLSFATLFLNHWITCAWIAVGRVAPSDTGHRWVDQTWWFSESPLDYLASPPLYQYITAFHWSVAQFTLGAIEISCSNTWERLFNIICMIVGLIFGSTLVSSLSATMVEFQMMKKEQTQKMRKLRQFLKENTVDRRIAVRVQQQATDRVGKKDEIKESDVPALKLISMSLLTELRLGLFKPHLLSHPLFSLWVSIDTNMVQRLCKDAITFLFLLPKDDLFHPATSSDHAFYVVSGSLNYLLDMEGVGVEDAEPTAQTVREGTWMCEAALWTEWIHVGRAEATTRAKLLSISAAGLLEALSRHRMVRDIALDYSKLYHSRIVSASPSGNMSLTDLEVPFTGWDDLVVTMGKEHQVRIGLVALDHINAQIDSGFFRRRTIPSGLAKLKQEVIRGKSCLLINAAGEVERVVSVVALRIERQSPEGTFVLVQLGKHSDGSMLPSCQLPGAKQESGESIERTINRILTSKLGPFYGHIEMESKDRQVECKPSPEYRVQTKYLRKVCTARLSSDVEATILEYKPAALAAFKRSVSGFSSESSSRASAAAPKLLQARPQLLKREVLCIDDQAGDQVYFAWLLSHEFDSLSSPGNEDQLAAWLSSLQQPPTPPTMQRSNAMSI